MFIDLGLVTSFNIDYSTLCRWLLTVKRNYRNETVQYHNWYHAFNVTQMMFCTITKTKWNQLFAKVSTIHTAIVFFFRNVNVSYVHNLSILNIHKCKEWVKKNVTHPVECVAITNPTKRKSWSTTKLSEKLLPHICGIFWHGGCFERQTVKHLFILWFN